MRKPKKRARKPKPAPAATGSTLEEVIAQLAEIRAKLAEPDLPDPTRTRLITERRQYLTLKASLIRKDALLESNVCEHPRWLAVRDRIVDAISGCDHCSEAVGKALGAV